MRKSKVKASKVYTLLVYDLGCKTPPGAQRAVRKESLKNRKGKALGQKLLAGALRFMRQLTTAVSKDKTVNMELIKLGFQLIMEIINGIVSKWLR